MRNYHLLMPIVFGLLLCIVTMTGCGETCENVDCGAFGSCSEISDEPICLCRGGYEEDTAGLCEIRSTSKFVGDWSVSERITFNENGSIGDRECAYTASIAESSQEVRRLLFTGVPDLDCLGDFPVTCDLRAEATVSRDEFTLRGTAIGISYCDDLGPDIDFSGFQLQGTDGGEEASGEISDDQTTITLSYRLSFTVDEDQNGVLETYTYDVMATMTKQ